MNNMRKFSFNAKNKLYAFFVLIFISASLLAQDAQISFDSSFGGTVVSSMPSTVDGVTINTSGIATAISNKDFCDSGTNSDVWEINSSASTTYTDKYIELTAPATATIDKIEIASSRASTDDVLGGILAWEGAVAATFAESYTFTALSDDNQVCGSPAYETIDFTGAIQVVRIYRKVTVDLATSTAGTGSDNLGDGSTICVGDIKIYLTPLASLSADPSSITNFNYGVGAGPSAAQTIDISGLNLDAGESVDIAALTNYEVSTDGVTYSSSLSFANTAGGTFSETVYVRLISGLALSSSYSETLTISGGGAASSATVDLDGSVTATALVQLSTPVLEDPTDATLDGFTARWNTVTNASSYVVNVYEGTTLVSTLTVSDPTQDSIIVTGLTGETTYKYTVTAIGNTTAYTDSPESDLSSGITTLPTPVASPCEITLYTTDFTDWDALDQSSASSGDVFSAGGGGEGFTVSAKPTVDPATDASGSLALGEYGSLYASNSSGDLLTSKTLTFLNGGTVIIYVFNNSTSDRGFQLTVDGSSTDITASYEYVEPTANSEVTTATVSGNGFETGYNDASDKRMILYKVTFDLPAGLTGDHTIEISEGSYSLTDLAFTRFSVCTSPDTDPIIAANPPEEMTFTGEVGGNEIMQYLEVKGFNLTDDVTVELIGDDASYFSISTSTITQADATSGFFLPVYYTTSVLTGSHSAQVKLSSAGADDVYIDLSGMSLPATTDPIITTDDATQLFAAALINTTTNTINVTGANLTGEVTATISGTDAAQFSLSASSVTAYLANGTGDEIEITYLGGTEAPTTHNATLTLSSTGADDVVIPLVGKTYSVDPNFYTLTSVANPTGSGLFITDIAGPTYPSGTLVTVTAVAESGYKFVKWSDITSYSATRKISMNSDVVITAIFEVGTSDGAIGDITAYYPTSITTTGFTAAWSTVSDASSYTVTVYDEDGTLLQTQTTTSTSLAITGLTENSMYSYQVEADSGDKTIMSGPYSLVEDSSLLPACGED